MGKLLNARINAALSILHLAALANSKSTSKRRIRQTKKEIERRRKVFDDTRPHHGDDLIEALEYENFMRDDYTKGTR